MATRKRYSRSTSRRTGRTGRTTRRRSYGSSAVRRSGKRYAGASRPQRVEIVMHHSYQGDGAFGLRAPGVPGTVGVSAQGREAPKKTF